MVFSQPICESVFKTKYMINGEKNPEDVLHEVAKKIASVEKTEELKKKYENLFFDVLEKRLFLPGGRILANARTFLNNRNLLNCFVIYIEDDLKDIYNKLKEDALISASGGGVGFNISHLRPNGAPISSGGESSGAISFLRVFNESAKIIQVGGKRRSAHIAILNCDHPDIEEFLTIKQGKKNNELTQFNISVGVTDKFIQAIENNDNWDLVFNGKVYKTVKARDLYNKMMRNMYDYNEPGAFFLDTANRYHNGWYLEQIESTNPCLTGDTNIKFRRKGDNIVQYTSIEQFIKIFNAAKEKNEELEIFSYDVKKNIYVWDTVVNVQKTKDNAYVYKILDIETGSYVKCTPDHKLYVKNVGWVKAENLSYQNVLVVDEELRKRNINLVNKLGIVELKEKYTVYDITTKNTHAFFANGILVHNCGEISMTPYESCCLGAINFSKLVKYPFENVHWKENFDFETLKYIVPIAVRFLNNVLDTTEYPIEKIKNKSLSFRRIGLGFTGLGSALAMLKIPYDSSEALEFSEEVASVLRNMAYISSVEEAREKGSFPLFDKEKFIQSNFVQQLPEYIINDIYTYGIRNVSLLTVAPTGTISIALGENCSSGIEPIFSLQYNRNIRTGRGDETVQETVYDYAWLLYNDYAKKKGIPVDLNNPPSFFKTAIKDISPISHIDIQSVFQKYIDNSISKTINLPKGYTFDEFKNLFMYAYKKGLKGFTTFNPFSTAEGAMDGVLSVSEGNKQRIAPKRTKELPAEIFVRTIKTKYDEDSKKYLVVVGLLNNKPYEVFLTNGNGNNIDIYQILDKYFKDEKHYQFTVLKEKKGEYILCIYDKKTHEKKESLPIHEFFNKDFEASTRLVSTALRHGIPLEFIVDQLNKASAFGSWGKAIATVLKKYDTEVILKSGGDCPNCGATLVKEEGCMICKNCGWGKC